MAVIDRRGLLGLLMGVACVASWAATRTEAADALDDRFPSDGLVEAGEGGVTLDQGKVGPGSGGGPGTRQRMRMQRAKAMGKQKDVGSGQGKGKRKGCRYGKGGGGGSLRCFD